MEAMAVLPWLRHMDIGGWKQIFLESTFLCSTESTATGSREGTSYATARFVGGTGKYAGIRGSLSSTTEFDTIPRHATTGPLIEANTGVPQRFMRLVLVVVNEPVVCDLLHRTN